MTLDEIIQAMQKTVNDFEESRAKQLQSRGVDRYWNPSIEMFKFVNGSKSDIEPTPNSPLNQIMDSIKEAMQTKAESRSEHQREIFKAISNDSPKSQFNQSLYGMSQYAKILMDYIETKGGDPIYEREMNSIMQLRELVNLVTSARAQPTASNLGTTACVFKPATEAAANNAPRPESLM